MSRCMGLKKMDALFLGLSVVLFLVAVGLAVASHRLEVKP